MSFVLTLILCTLSSYILYYIFTIIGGKNGCKLQKGLFDQTPDFLNISDLHVHRIDLKLSASTGKCSQRYIHNCLYASGKSALYMHCTSNWLLPSIQLIPWRHTPCPLSKNRALQRFTVTDSKWLMEESARMCASVSEWMNYVTYSSSVRQHRVKQAVKITIHPSVRLQVWERGEDFEVCSSHSQYVRTYVWRSDVPWLIASELDMAVDMTSSFVLKPPPNRLL